jgi:molecular chaperone HtpG
LKEGVSSDYENKERILSLLLFQSSADVEKLTALKGYVERMKEGQDEIYYLTGESRAVVENSPHLEAFKEKGYEALYLTEQVDELFVQSLWDYEGKKPKSAGKGTIKLGDNQEEKEKAQAELKKKEEEAADLFAAMQKALGEHIKQVCLSNRLVASPACLVGAEIDYSPQMERLLQKGKGGGPRHQSKIPASSPPVRRCRNSHATRQGEEGLGRAALLVVRIRLRPTGRGGRFIIGGMGRFLFLQMAVQEECSMSYKVYLYNIPKVSEDGKQAIPIPDSQSKEFDGIDDAKIFAAEHKNSFDRVVLMQEDNEGQKMVVRYTV